MPVNIVVPQLGESVVEATVREWLKKQGDAVNVGDPLVRLETDKVDLEVGAEQAGVLASIERGEGEDVKVGDVLGVIDAAAAAPGLSGEGQATAGMGTAGAPAREQKAPETVAAGQPQRGTARATLEGLPDEGAEVRAAAEENVPPAEATPVARRMAEELGIDLTRVPGSGAKGRVTKEDVESYAQQTSTSEAVEAPKSQQAPAQVEPVRPEPVRPAPAAAPQPPPFAEARRERRERLSRRRQTIARRLVEAQQTAAMLTTFNEIDMGTVMDVRKRRRESFEQRHGIRLGFMSFFVKASIGALKEFPRVNAEMQGDEIVYKDYYDVGIAVGAEEGLVVPVLRDADRLTFAEIEREIRAFSEKAQKGTLTLEELRGGTFTLTNGGVFGSLMSTPILNPPQVGILGLHKIEDRPVVRDGQIVIRPMMYVALSYDHRIVDGREAVQFLVRIKEMVEDPESLLLEG